MLHQQADVPLTRRQVPWAMSSFQARQAMELKEATPKLGHEHYTRNGLQKIPYYSRGSGFFGSFWEIILVNFGLLQLIGDLPDPKNGFWETHRLSPQVARALELVWDPVFGHFREKCAGFSDFCNFDFKKSTSLGLYFLSNIFLCVS